jgi:hypothetical protein
MSPGSGSNVKEQSVAITFEVEASSKQDLPLERIEEEVRQLQNDLRQLHVDSIEPVSGAAPPGTKAAEVFAWGSLLVALAPDLVKQALSIMLDWVRRDSSRTITIRPTKGGPESGYVITGIWKAAELAEIMKVLAKQEGTGTHAS